MKTLLISFCSFIFFGSASAFQSKPTEADNAAQDSLNEVWRNANASTKRLSEKSKETVLVWLRSGSWLTGEEDPIASPPLLRCMFKGEGIDFWLVELYADKYVAVRKVRKKANKAMEVDHKSFRLVNNSKIYAVLKEALPNK